MGIIRQNIEWPQYNMLKALVFKKKGLRYSQYTHFVQVDLKKNKMEISEMKKC